MDRAQNNKEKIKKPLSEIPAVEQAVNFEQEQEPVPEKREKLDEKLVSEQLKREIEMMEIDDNLKKQAEQKASRISFMADDDKLENLLKIAREKGVIFAVKVAKSMNEPYLLDSFHDLLAKNGFYEHLIK